LGTEVRADSILVAGEYAKGFIDFDADLPEGAVEIWTRTADQPGDEAR